MIIKKIASICKAHKALHIFDNGNVQWAGDSIAAYPLHELPYVTAEELCAFFDFPEKVKEKMTIRQVPMPVGLNADDCCENEIPIRELNMGIYWGGMDLTVLKTPTGVCFIESAYLGPVRDLLDTLELFERRNAAGRPYIVLKSGMLIYGIIMPMQILSNDFVADIQGLAQLCTIALENEENERAAREDKFLQTKMDEEIDAAAEEFND